MDILAIFIFLGEDENRRYTQYIELLVKDKSIYSMHLRLSFWFNGNKIITTSGGGMLLSDDEEAIKKARFWSTQSRDPAPWYQHSEIGYNYRMSNIVAGIGRGQLLHIEEHRALKKAIYKRYKEEFQGLPLSMNPYLPCSEPNFWLSCILLDESWGVKPIKIIDTLSKHNIEARPIWKPMHMQPVFDGHDFISVDGDVGAEIFTCGLCLPSDIKMTLDEQGRVIDIIKELLSCEKVRTASIADM